MDLRAVGASRWSARTCSAPASTARRAPTAGRPQPRKARPPAPSRPSGPAAPRPTSLVVDGANAGESVPLDDAPILIGRGTDAAIRLDDDYVSTRHARIASSGDQWFVEDLGSTNGTYIGSHRLTQPTTLQLGSKVRIGKTTLELRK